MKRLPIILALLCLMSITISFGSAQGNESHTEPSQNETITDLDLFTWANTDPPNWTLGILYAFLGLVGALVAIFTLIGGAVPGTAGKAIIDDDTIRLKNNSDRLDELIKSKPCEPECIKALATAVNDLRDDINAEKWHQFKYAVPMYLILGAVFASMLALNLLQAILIGFGWTGVTGILGLKSDFEYRKSVKDKELETLWTENKELKEKVSPSVSTKGEDSEEIAKLREENKKTAAKLEDLRKTNYYRARQL